MRVKSRNEFKELKEPVESRLESSLKERESLGLSTPQKFDAFVKFYPVEKAQALADHNEGEPYLSINLAPIVLGQLEGNNNQKMSALMQNYFDKFREIFGYEDNIFSLMYYPHKTIKNLKESFNQEDLIKKNDFFKSRGKSFYDYLNEAQEISKFARNYFREILPDTKEKFKSEDSLKKTLGLLRHELDHVDFYQNSNLFKKHLEKLNEVGEFHRKFMEGENVSKQYAQKQLETLESISEVDVTMEARAHFFNQIDLNDWINANYEKSKSNILGDLSLAYVESHWLDPLMNALLSQKWSEGRMNRETSNYLFALTSSQSRSSDTEKYILDKEKVNYDIANKVLYDEIPQWKKMFAENSKTAVNAIGDAYENDPSRLKRANEATNFNDFIEYARGKK